MATIDYPENAKPLAESPGYSVAASPDGAAVIVSLSVLAGDAGSETTVTGAVGRVDSRPGGELAPYLYADGDAARRVPIAVSGSGLAGHVAAVVREHRRASWADARDAVTEYLAGL